jgi:hypothetical protein
MHCTERNRIVMRLFVTFWCNVVWQVLDENDTVYSLFAPSYSHDGGESGKVLISRRQRRQLITRGWSRRVIIG